MKRGEAVCCYVRVGVRVRVTVIVAGSTWRGWGGLLLCQGRCQGQGYSDWSRVDMKRGEAVCCYVRVGVRGLQWLKQGRHEAWWGGLLLCQGRCQGQGYSDCSRVDMKRVRRSAAMSGSVSGSGLQWLKQGRHEAWWGGLLLCQGRCQGVTVIEAGSTWRVVRRSAAMSGSVSGSGLVNEAGSTWSMVRRSAAMSGSVSGSGLQWLKQGRHEAWWGGLLLCQGRCQGVTVIEAGSTWSMVRRSAAMSGSVSGSGLQWLKQGRHEAWWGGLLLCQGRCQGQGYSDWSRVDMKRGEAVCCYVRVGVRVRVTVIEAGSTWSVVRRSAAMSGSVSGGYSDWSRVDMKHGEAVCCYVRVGVRVRVTVIEAGSTWSVVRRSAAMSGSVSGSGLQWLKQGRHEAWWGGLLLCQGRCQGQGYSDWSRVDMKRGEAVCCYVRVGVRGLQWLKQGRHEAWWGGLLLCQGRCQGQGYSDWSRVDMKRGEAVCCYVRVGVRVRVTVIEAGSTRSVVRRSAAMSGSVSGSGLQWLKQGRHEAWWGGLLLCQGRCQGVRVNAECPTWSMTTRSPARCTSAYPVICAMRSLHARWRSFCRSRKLPSCCLRT